jgi:hypothetical protein
MILILPSADKRRRTKLVTLALMFFISLYAAHLVNGLINKQQILPMHPYTAFYSQFKFFFRTLFDYSKENFSIAIVLVTYVAIYGISLYQCRLKLKLFYCHQLSAEEERDFLLKIIFTLTAVINFFAAISPWDDISGCRYLMFFSYTPFLLFAHILPKSSSTFRIIFSKITIFIVAVGCVLSSVIYSIQHYDFSKSLFQNEKNEASALNLCIKNLGLHRGFAKYWSARKYQFISYNQLQFAQIPPWHLSNNNLLFYWGNNAFSFLQNTDDSSPFDYILADNIDDMDKQTIFYRFGEPNQITHCGKKEIWIYRNPTMLYAGLIEGHNEPYMRFLYVNHYVKLPAIAFSSQTGQRSGFSREAFPSKDHPGFILYGNYMPLKKGHYRFDLHYSLLGIVNESHMKASSVFEIVTNLGNLLLKRKSLTFDHQDNNISLLIHLDQDTIVEPRVFFNDRIPLVIDNVSITQL